MLIAAIWNHLGCDNLATFGFDKGWNIFIWSVFIDQCCDINTKFFYRLGLQRFNTHALLCTSNLVTMHARCQLIEFKCELTTAGTDCKSLTFTIASRTLKAGALCRRFSNRTFNMNQRFVGCFCNCLRNQGTASTCTTTGHSPL